MKTQELIHLHALLVELRTYVEAEESAPSGAFASYDAQPVRPSHIHRQKEAHKNAVDLLLDGFERVVQSNPPPNYALVA
ncbi:UPF0058 family protein [Halovivax limisalsi]|uniref:UPF0058 family protein n=1 Tax=Halovivax limisalsi TaxID=1453760 RepID=UPI001FFD020A|nr:UPF0058 family protein [Halovivax limisalsi]